MLRVSAISITETGGAEKRSPKTEFYIAMQEARTMEPSNNLFSQSTRLDLTRNQGYTQHTRNTHAVVVCSTWCGIKSNSLIFLVDISTTNLNLYKQIYTVILPSYII